jgi:hypothetical protein
VGVVGGDVAAGGTDKVGEGSAVEACVVLGEGVAGESEHFCVAIGDQRCSSVLNEVPQASQAS